MSEHEIIPSMKAILQIVIVAMIIVIINEIFYLGDTSLAFVLIVMAASIGTVAYVAIQISDKTK